MKKPLGTFKVELELTNSNSFKQVQQKVKKLNQLLEEANSLVDELASMEIDVSVKLNQH
ncbi:hypothetical protein [Rummeliibacillus stabekisii]|uniref:hypothetical protein n=1 Tax=Rummeliibacillus stabekisii TaxID=241244 RepID=UPI001314CE73|nr:hypothetical protein [Rummeliibacillus stabekisii]